MPTIIRHQLEHGVERISLNSGGGNPLTPELIADLSAVLDELSAAPPRALVLDADGARIFSAGFALPIIWDWDRDRLWNFFSGFVDIVHKFLALPVHLLLQLRTIHRRRLYTQLPPISVWWVR